MEPLLQLKNISKTFSVGGGQKKNAIQDVDLVVRKGETLGIVGESGCGKSTLARLIMGVYPVSGGEILFRGKKLELDKQKSRKEFANHAQMIFQDPYTSLDPRMSVRDILSENLEIQGRFNKEERIQRVYELLDMVGLSKEHGSRFPHEFSGGQRQRIGIARALALQPELILCDEPISSLDISIQSQIMNLLIRLKKEMGLTYIFIAHDLTMVRYLSDRIAVMSEGRIVETGETDKVYQNPQHPYTQKLLQAQLSIEPDALDEQG